MDVNTVKCDICGRQKQETNHWLVAITVSNLGGVLFEAADEAVNPRRQGYDYQDICGQECAHKRLSQYLDSLK